MRLKKSKINKTERTTFRHIKEQTNAIQRKANIYTDGNVSEYCLYAALNFVAGKEDFEEDKPNKKKGKRK